MASSASLTTTHLPRLRTELADWAAKQKPVAGFSVPLEEIGDAVSTSTKGGKDVVVAFRTRPPLDHEAEDKFKSSDAYAAFRKEGEAENEKEEVTAPAEPATEFCSGISVTGAEPGVFVAHVPGFKWNGPTLAHKTFEADLAFGPDVQNDEVYKRTVIANDILSLVVNGGVGCILAYGQTGSGKTYTMESLEQRIAADIFRVAEVEAQKYLSTETASDLPEGESVYEISVTSLELLGKFAVDLIEGSDKVDSEGNPIRKEVAIREDRVGEVRPDLISTIVRSAEQLQAHITAALSHRRTSETTRNKSSSRSHALLTIWIKNNLLPYTQHGQLILVDLAGSERYEDSKAHSKKLMDESRENNKSLMNLKECVRAKAKMASEDGFVHIPWRMNKLTMLLKPIFDVESRQKSRTVIIAHVSPHIQDSVHSVNTLGYASPFKTSPPKPRGPAPYSAEDPRTWNHEQTVLWLTKQFTARVRRRKEASWAVQAKKIEAQGKILKALDPNAEVQLPLDVQKLCPDGMTATNIAQMYTVQFVHAVLQAAVREDEREPLKSETETLKDMAVDIATTLYRLTVSAKMKTRTEIMKSRKVLSDDIYGEKPVFSAQVAAEQEARRRDYVNSLKVEYTPEEKASAKEFFGKNWDLSIEEASRFAEDNDLARDIAKNQAIQAMMRHWKSGGHQKIAQ